MTRALSFALVLSSAFVAASARADDAACFSAAVDGQKLQRSGKLLDAHAAFLTCAQRACPAAVVDKCAGWLHDVEAATPSLTIAVRDEHGGDVAATRATVDDRDATTATGGRALEVDPGSHVVAVEARGKTLTQTIIMHEAERVRAVVFELPKEKSDAAPVVDAPPDRSPSHAALYGAITAGSVAVASGVVFGVFAVKGLSDRSSFRCADGCPSDQYDRVHHELFAADVALGVTAGALVVATVLFALRPSSRASGAAMAHAFPRPALGFAF